MTNYLLAVTQAVTNPNVIVLNTFWLGVWFTFFFICWLIYLGFKKKVLQVPKFISAREAFNNFLEIVNKNATNEGKMQVFIDEASEIRDALQKYVQKNGDHDQIVFLKKNMVEHTGDKLLDQLIAIVNDITSLSGLLKKNVDLAQEKIDYRRNYYDNKKVPQTKKVEVDNGRGSWQYVDAQYTPKQETQATPDFEVFSGFFTQREMDEMARNGLKGSPIILEETAYFQVEYRNGQTDKLTGKQIQDMQSRKENRLIYRVDFIIKRKV